MKTPLHIGTTALLAAGYGPLLRSYDVCFVQRALQMPNKKTQESQKVYRGACITVIG